MKMITNRLFAALLVFSYVNNLQTMEPEKTSPFGGLPLEMQHYVVQIMSATSSAESLQDAGKTIAALAVTNKELNELVNDPTLCLTIIKNLAKRFGCSDQKATEGLQTQEAEKRLEIQQEFFDLCNKNANDFTQEEFNILYGKYKGYVDLNFTYDIPFQLHGYEPDNIETNLLKLAIDGANCALIQLLLTHGADINQTNADGYSLLNTAVSTNNSNIVKCVLENSKPIIDLQDDEGFTALMFAATNNNCDIIKQLLEYGADINKGDNNKITPLMIAANNGCVQAVQCLLQNSSIKINARDGFGSTAFIYAVCAEENNCPMIEIFLRHGVDINQVDDEGATVLIMAISLNKMDVFECLVYNRNIAIDQADKEGRTALMFAVIKKHYAMVQILLNKGANPNIATYGGLTPLQAAQRIGDQKIIVLIMDAIKKWDLKAHK